VLPQGNKYCPPLRKECFEIPGLNSSRRRLERKKKKMEKRFEEGNCIIPLG